MTRQAEQMVRHIRTLLKAFTIDEKRFPPAEGHLKYNGIDFQALIYVSTCPGCRSAELARHLSVSPTTAQSAVDRLVARGLLTREARPGGGRSVALRLTREGRTVRDAIERQDVANCETMLAALPAGARRAFIEQLATIARAVTAADGVEPGGRK